MDTKDLSHLKDKVVEIGRVEANDHPGRGFAHGIQEKAGKTLCPDGFDYAGTATVHIYTKFTPGGLSDRTDTAFISVLHGFENIPEPMADAAFKELMRELMKQYGREIPEFRKS